MNIKYINNISISLREGQGESNSCEPGVATGLSQVAAIGTNLAYVNGVAIQNTLHSATTTARADGSLVKTLSALY